jgi:hypothetical protein
MSGVEEFAKKHGLSVGEIQSTDINSETPTVVVQLLDVKSKACGWDNARSIVRLRELESSMGKARFLSGGVTLPITHQHIHEPLPKILADCYDCEFVLEKK